jgi:TIR domain-containing protein
MVPFVVSFLEPLADLVPQSLVGELRAATCLLGGLLALLVHERHSLPSLGRKLLRAWMLGAPAGLVLLGIFQWQFTVRFPLPQGRRGSQIIAPPRLSTCPCKETSDADCLREELNLSPESLAQCWDASRMSRNRLAWSFAYVLALGGLQIVLVPLGLSAAEGRRVQPVAAPRPAGAERALFLSYSRRDREFAERLAGDLQERGIAVWWDWWEMEVGDTLPRKIEEAISGSAWLAVVLSPDSVASPWVQTELDLARTLEIEGRLLILPVLYRSCGIPLSLRSRVWADFTSSYEAGLESLLDRLALPPAVDPGGKRGS